MAEEKSKRQKITVYVANDYVNTMGVLVEVVMDKNNEDKEIHVSIHSRTEKRDGAFMLGPNQRLVLEDPTLAADETT